MGSGIKFGDAAQTKHSLLYVIFPRIVVKDRNLEVLMNSLKYRCGTVSDVGRCE